MAVTDAQLLDLIQTTQANLPHLEFEIGWDNQDYEFCRIYQNERMEVDGGTQIERKVMFDNTGNAKYRYLYDTDKPTVDDVMHTITVPWCNISTNWSWDELEILRNRGSAVKIIDLVQVRRTDGLWALANLIEERAWKTPTSATDKKYPFGVPYYLTPYTDTSGTVNTSSGFVGKAVKFQNGTYNYTCAGISADDEAKWRNYAAVYTAVNNTLLKSFRLAFMYTKFKAPINIKDPAQKVNAAKRVYTDFVTTGDLMDLADQRDDKHSGKDVLGNIKVDDTGLVYLNRLPVIPVAELNDASLTPIYCVDFTKFRPVTQEGYWMKESEPMKDRGQHTTITTFLDGSHNNLCLNKRTCGFLMHKVS